MGFFEEHHADGSVRRGETYTCAHCNRPVEWKDNMGLLKPPPMCSREMKPICEPCAKTLDRIGKCIVFEKRLEAIERRDRLLKAAGLR